MLLLLLLLLFLIARACAFVKTSGVLWKIFSHFLSRKSLESVVTFSHHHMLNRRPSRIEVKPEDRQEEVQTKKKRRSVMSFVRSSFSFKLLLSLSVVSALVSVLKIFFLRLNLFLSLSRNSTTTRAERTWKD